MALLLGQTRTPFKGGAYQYIRTTDHLPSTDAAAAADDPLCKVKLFTPVGRGSWFIAGFDPDTGLAYGVADLFEREVGDIDLNELAAVRTRPFGLPIERDLYWTPQTIKELTS